MRVNKEDIQWAATQAEISESQAEALWQALSERMVDRPRFNLVNVLYYFGALLVILTLSSFMSITWTQLGAEGTFLLSSLYAVGFYIVGSKLRVRPGLMVPGGLLITAAVCMTPLIVYGFQGWTGIWGGDDPGEYRSFHLWVKGGWFYMELATILVGLVALRYFRFPFITAPIAFVLWYMSMDLTPIIFETADFSWEERKLVSLCFGLLMIIGSWFVDHKTKEDYAFWGYLFGMIAFWGGLSLINSDNELSKFMYFLINIFLMGASVYFQRKVFMVFGAIGSIGYFGYLSTEYFDDFILFPLILTFSGMILIYCGVLLNRHSEKIEKALMDAMPTWMHDLRPTNR